MEKGSEAGGQQQSPQGQEPTEGRRLEEKRGGWGNRGGMGAAVSLSLMTMLDITLLGFFCQLYIKQDHTCNPSLDVAVFKLLIHYVLCEILIVGVVREWSLCTCEPLCNHLR